MTKPKMTAAAFDTMLKPPSRTIWGAAAIARVLGVSVDTVRRLSTEPGVPIYRPSDRYFAYRAELDAWLRTKPVQAKP